MKKSCNILNSKGEKIGLISGCFDIIHPGHVDLFRFSKRYIDILIILLENDETIRISKGQNRPIFSFNDRAKVLSEFESIDFIIRIDNAVDFRTFDADDFYENIIKQLKIYAIITNPCADQYWENKKRRAEKLNIKFIEFKIHVSCSSSIIKEKLENNF